MGQLSKMSAIFDLWSLMFDGRGADAIIKLAADSVPSISQCRTEAAYRVQHGSLADGFDPHRPLNRGLDAMVVDNFGTDLEISLRDGIWRFVFMLRASQGITGALVVCAASAPPPDELALLTALGKQAAAAMACATLVERAREQEFRLRKLIDERQRTIERQSQMVALLERHEQIHAALTGMSASGGGEAGIADKLHELTSFPVGIEDTFGNLRAWSSGGATPANYRQIGGANREELLRDAAASGQLGRDGDRVFSVIRSRGDILGAVVLWDPDRRASAIDKFTLDYGATLLALELSHSRDLAAAELRRRRELAEDLLSGTDDESAYARGEAIGHDLRTPHSVAVLHWEDTNGRGIAKAAARWANSSGQHCIIARRPAFAILLTAGEPDPADLHRAISTDVGSERGSIGLGSVVAVPSRLPRSFSEAQRALEIKQGCPAPYGTRRFEDLGVYRILDPGDSRQEVRGFVLEWLGDLIDYDRTKHADLVKTLARYLDCGGNYDLTADSLKVHRSTLRYRLRRIRDITGRDLKDADARLNLHLATRVLDVIGPQGQTGSTSSGSR
jgi:hypothetical protein